MLSQKPSLFGLAVELGPAQSQLVMFFLPILVHAQLKTTQVTTAVEDNCPSATTAPVRQILKIVIFQLKIGLKMALNGQNCRFFIHRTIYGPMLPCLRSIQLIGMRLFCKIM